MRTLQVSKSFEIDAAHYLLDHYGPCQYLHGHRYRFDITVYGRLDNRHIPDVKTPDMLLDFSYLRHLFLSTMGLWDHAALLPLTVGQWNDIQKVLTPTDLRRLGLHASNRIFCLGFNPTAENLVQEAAIMFGHEIATCGIDFTHLSRFSIRLHESPNSFAETSFSFPWSGVNS